MDMKKDRVKLAFDESGSQNLFVNGQNPPIILMHDVTSSKETWKRILKPLADATNRKVYSFDFRNHGDSGRSNAHYYDLMQEDLEQLMECLHIKKAVLIGHGMGGKVAMLFALRKPGMVDRIIVEDMLPTPSSLNFRKYVKNYLTCLTEAVEKIPSHIKELSEAKEFITKFLRNLQPGIYIEAATVPLTKDKNGTFTWKTNMKVVEENCMSGFKNPLALEGEYKGPVLILYEANSPYYKKSEEDFVSDFFPKAVFKPVEGAGHQIHLAFADLFINEASNFISRSRR